MAKPFDATTKHLIEVDPLAWLRLAELPGTAVKLIDADLSTVTSAADRVLHVEEPEPYLAHFELQSSRLADLDEREMRTAAMLHYQHGLPVETVVILLRREADGPASSGQAGFRSPSGWTEMKFKYRVLRVWELPVESLLAGALATLPLAPLASVSPEALPSIVTRMEDRVRQEASPAEAGIIWTATYVLMGLRYDRDLVHHLLKGVRGMEESVTYQEIIEKGEARGRAMGLREGEAKGLREGEMRGKIEEARRVLVRLGSKRLGPPDESTLGRIEALDSLERLELLVEQAVDAVNWQDLVP